MAQSTQNNDDALRVSVLSEALPYIQRFAGRRIVIKYGGAAMAHAELRAAVFRDLALLACVGVQPVVVHGGGPRINEMLEKLGVTSTFTRGKRVTDAATMAVVEMVLSGQVNKRIVQAINAEGGRAVGLSGKDASMNSCTMADPELGFVGEPSEVDTTLLRQLFEAEMIPVIAPIGADRDGHSYNINGDTAAGAIAAALKADRLLLLTDVSGVKNADGEVVTELSAADVEAMTESGVIAGGMIPKTETALSAVRAGVRAAVILDGRAPNACLLELFTDHGAGSIIRA